MSAGTCSWVLRRRRPLQLRSPSTFCVTGGQSTHCRRVSFRAGSDATQEKRRSSPPPSPVRGWWLGADVPGPCSGQHGLLCSAREGVVRTEAVPRPECSYVLVLARAFAIATSSSWRWSSWCSWWFPSGLPCWASLFPGAPRRVLWPSSVSAWGSLLCRSVPSRVGSECAVDSLLVPRAVGDLRVIVAPFSSGSCGLLRLPAVFPQTSPQLLHFAVLTAFPELRGARQVERFAAFSFDIGRKYFSILEGSPQFFCSSQLQIQEDAEERASHRLR